MADHGDARETERTRDINEDLRHGALADSAAIKRLRGNSRITVAWKVCRDHSEFVGEVGSDLSPCNAGFRVTMQQQDERATAGSTQEHCPSRDSDGLTRERIKLHTCDRRTG